MIMERLIIVEHSLRVGDIDKYKKFSSYTRVKDIKVHHPDAGRIYGKLTNIAHGLKAFDGSALLEGGMLLTNHPIKGFYCSLLVLWVVGLYEKVCSSVFGIASENAWKPYNEYCQLVFGNEVGPADIVDVLEKPLPPVVFRS